MKETKLILKKIYEIIVIKFFEILYGKIEFKNNFRGNIQRIYLNNNNFKKGKKKRYCVSIFIF